MMLRDLSLRRTVPLYIGAGFLLVIGAWTWVAYQNVRAAAVAVGQERLSVVTKQFASMYETAAREYGRGLHAAGALQPIADFVASNGTANSDSLRRLFKRFTVAPNHQIELVALDGRPLVSFPDSQAAGSGERHEELSAVYQGAAKGPLFAEVAPLRMLDDSVVVPVVTAVVRDSQPIGYLVLWRRVTSTPQAREQASNLIGADARIYLGNARGDLWADMAGSVHRFPVSLDLEGHAAQYARDDSTTVLSVARRVAGTPWAIVVEFNDASILAPSDQFLKRSVIIGFIVLVVATTSAWLLSRRLTNPLHELSEAASAMAGGDYTRRVSLGRRDEIGQLSTAFNVMATHVGDAQHALETKVSERTAEIRERNEELEAFAHSISHDLRAPLRAMHGFSQALLEDCSDQLDDTGKDYLRRIARASHHMDLLTQDLLAYSQVSRGEISLAPVDLQETAQAAVEQLEADIAARNARVVIHGPLPAVLGYRPSIMQAVANLVSNGLKFVAEGKEPVIDIRGETHPGWVRLWVEDNGIGIDPTHHQRIFSVFERLHSNDKYAGTGIGLAIVRKAVERMGGRAGVDSGLGSGSRFWIELQATETS